MKSIGYVLEGGSIDSDGQGTILTTARCLLTPTRNHAANRRNVAGLFRRELGVTRILWLHSGHLAGDDTDGHVDTLARFCDEQTIAYVACDDEGDEHFADLKRMEQELALFRTRGGEPYRLARPRRCRHVFRIARLSASIVAA